MKVSFDFDGTLDKPTVQAYAKELIEKGIEVWIVTARLSDYKAPSDTWNDDLYNIAALVGIDTNRIVFTDNTEKYHYFRNRSFVWHLDDHWPTLGLINRFTGTRGISVCGHNHWRKECGCSIIRAKEFTHPLKRK